LEERAMMNCGLPASGVQATSVINLEYEFSDGFAARYIRRKAWQLVGVAGYSRGDQADLQQDLAVALLQRIPKFNPGRGHWNVFVVTVIERQVATLLAARRARKRLAAVERLALQTSAVGDASPHVAQIAIRGQQAARPYAAGRDELETFESQHDIALVLRRLPAELRIVWDWLQTDTVRDTARGLRVSPQTIYQRLKRLRLAFQAADLGKYCPKLPESLDTRPAIPVGT